MGWYTAECENLDSCEPGTTHRFPEPGTAVRIRGDEPWPTRMIGTDCVDVLLTPGMEGTVTDDVIHEAHQVGFLTVGGFAKVWVDVDEEIEEVA